MDQGPPPPQYGRVPVQTLRRGRKCHECAQHRWARVGQSLERADPGSAASPSSWAACRCSTPHTRLHLPTQSQSPTRQAPSQRLADMPRISPWRQSQPPRDALSTCTQQPPFSTYHADDTPLALGLSGPRKSVRALLHADMADLKKRHANVAPTSHTTPKLTNSASMAPQREA